MDQTPELKGYCSLTQLLNKEQFLDIDHELQASSSGHSMFGRSEIADLALRNGCCSRPACFLFNLLIAFARTRTFGWHICIHNTYFTCSFFLSHEATQTYSLVVGMRHSNSTIRT